VLVLLVRFGISQMDVLTRLSFVIKGTRMSSTFDGECVATIVFTGPIRSVKREASSAEIR